MTILPKKKTGKEKSEAETRPSGDHLTHAQPSETRVSRRNSPPPRWSSPAPRDDVRTGHDPGTRYDDYPSIEATSGHNNKRRHPGHRPSPHRNVRKHRQHVQTSSSSREPKGVATPAVLPHPHPHPHPQHPAHTHRHSYEPTSYMAAAASTSTEPSNVDLDIEGHNSGDEYVAPKSVEDIEELESWFESSLKEKRGFSIKPMGDDGACLFRAVADQVYGDQEMHPIVRQNVIDYMAKNADFFKQYVTEDFNTYLNRKRCDNCHGNHVEIQAMCELFNRPVEVYQYATEPINTFHSAYKCDNVPIRLSYHRNVHYNSVVDPYNASIGVGLGLPGLHPGAADKSLMRDAKQKSEDFHIEQTMLEDKLRETDWELTQETIEEQVARESYLQWLRDQEKRAKRHSSSHSASAACSSSSEPQPSWWENLSPTTRSPEPRPSRSPRNSANNSAPGSPNHVDMQTDLPPPTATDTQLLPGTTVSAKSPRPATNPGEGCSHSSSLEGAVGGVGVQFSETMSIMNEIPAQMFGLSDYDEDDILAQVMAQSQQEYMDSLRHSSPSCSGATTSGGATNLDFPGACSDS